MTIHEHLDRLDKLCEGATPRRWVYRRGRVYGHIATEDGRYIFERGFGVRVNADAEYIASANPIVLMALIEIARAAYECDCTGGRIAAALAALEGAVEGEG